MELKWIVYITINLCNGKFYIGVHKTNPDVWDGYLGCGCYGKRNATKNFPLHKAIRKYGEENFKRTTIRVFPNTDEGKKQAFDLEAQLVTETLVKSKTCYNVALGGGDSCSEKKRVYQFGLNGEFLRSHESASAAAASLNFHEDLYTATKAIRNNCLGTTSSSYGYVWSYKKEFIEPKSGNKRKIAQYTLTGKFIRSFESIYEAEVLLGLNSIQQAIAKKYHAGGYQWRFYTDDSNIESYFSVKTKNRTQPIIMIDKNGVKTEFPSISECARVNNLSSSQINRVLKKIIHTHKGYKFEYK